MKKRNDKRTRQKLIVSYSDNGFEHLGMSADLSKNGICISSDKGILEHREVTVSIAVPGEVLNLKGEVMWCKHSDDVKDSIPESIGIRITEAPAEYLNYVEYIKHKKIKQGKPEF